MKKALKAFGLIFPPPGSFPEAIPSLTKSSDAFLAATLAGESGFSPPNVVLAITPGIPDADRLSDDLNVLGVKTLDFPILSGTEKNALGARIKTVAALKAWSIKPYPLVVVAPFSALSTPVSDESKRNLRLQSGNSAVDFGFLAKRLPELGYNRAVVVEKEGDYSIRGGIVDIWSAGEDFPIRAEFFGDSLESLRIFSPATQTSIEKIKECEIYPVNEDNGDNSPASTILDFIPAQSTILSLEHNSYSLPILPENLKVIFTGLPAPRGVALVDFQTTPLPGFSDLDARASHHPELFDLARKRLHDHLEAARKRGSLVFESDGLSGGFELGDLIVVTKADRVFTKRAVRSRPAAAKSGRRLDSFEELEPGEYVVHVNYGVGRYVGTSEITVDGKRTEAFTIEYAEGAKLHVPAAHAHLISRYIGVKGESVKMHRLDGKSWRKSKSDAEKAVADLALSLLETQASRETLPGFAFDVNCEGIEAFEAAFAHVETLDQSLAVENVKKDMAKPRPMDRLICGDAGFGKTEVAMRAAFIAAMNGKQVALLAPTTVLAEQHFETFTARFDGTPIRIEGVSRFQSAGTHEGTFKRLAAGVCDIVIGTHALISGKIKFHDLGLIIIDEEQRFGVRHKEFLKKLKSSADVLTLSATPIPRTLYLSMTGVRDMSLIRTPPNERVAVETKIIREDDLLIKNAIEKELLRAGQVYFLHNRVHTIGKVEKRLRSLCPEARIVTVHGQMDTRTLAGKMRAFERGEYDILLSTTIIESGIDIPRANTILIDRADTFGIAELYQLRGRVGRSSKQGFAYLLLPASGDIDSDARERLAALNRHRELGAGFNLSVRDLELRGAGNLLGSQQSGHIAAVGFSLYCQLLKRTISIMKGQKPETTIDVRLNLDFAEPAIAHTYIEEDQLRFSFLKRYALAKNINEVKNVTHEMIDRFGPLPAATAEFVKCAELRILAAKAGISNIDVKDSRAVFSEDRSRNIVRVETLRGKTPKAKLDELLRMMRSKPA